MSIQIFRCRRSVFSIGSMQWLLHLSASGESVLDLVSAQNY